MHYSIFGHVYWDTSSFSLQYVQKINIIDYLLHIFFEL